MSIESLLLSDRDHLHQKSIVIRRAAQIRLNQILKTIESEFQYETLGLAVSAHIPQAPLKFNRTHDEDILFYLKFPYLFYELYAQVPLKQYDQLAISQYLYLSHVLMLDHLMDGKLLVEPQIAYWLNSAYQKIISILNELFDAASPFWAYFEKCRIENTQALTLERLNHTYRVGEYCEQEKILIFSGKSAMAKAGLAALAYLSQQDVSEELSLSCEAFHVGLQLMDNLQDWRSDYRDHLYTPLLTQVLRNHHLADDAECPQRADVNMIGSLIYGQGYAAATLKEATDTFKLALYAARDIKCPAWQNEILGMLQGCEQYAAAIEQKLLAMQTKRKAQPSIQAVQQSIPHEIITSPEQLTSAWTTNFCVATQTTQTETNVTGWVGDPSAFVLATDEILARCALEIPAPVGLQVYILNLSQIPVSTCFVHEEKWQIVLNQANLLGDIHTQLAVFKEHLAYQYGRMSRLRYAPKPEIFLDSLCIEGFGLVFVTKIFSAPEQSVLLPKDLNWFERNKHYLWQEVQAYLSSPLPFDFAHVFNFDHLEALLSYDLISSYCERMGDKALQQGAQSSTENILNKSTALAIADRIAGTKSVRFDL